MKKTKVCSVPWRSLYIHSNGRAFACCLIKKNLGNYSDRSIEEIWKGAELQELRKKHLEGSPTPECRTCWSREEHGLRSRRQLFDRDLYEYSQIPVSQIDPYPGLDSILHFDISFGNLCNLKCRFCSPDKSSKWQKMISERPPSACFEMHHEDSVNIQPIDGKKLISEILLLTGLRFLEIKGGEPLIHPSHSQLLEALVVSGRAEKMTLQYSTNLVKIPERVLELWDHFKVVDVAVSIDGTEEVQKYIRGKEASLEEVIRPNILKLRQHKNIKISTHTTVCVYNFENLVNLFVRLRQADLGLFRNSIGIVSEPNFLSPFMLPKERAHEALKAMLASEFEVLREMASRLIVDQFGGDSNSRALLEEFNAEF